MSNIKINDVPQRIQYVATSGQTQFSIPFPFFQNNYVYVWQDGVQLDIGAAPGEYGITGAGSPSGGQITLVTPAIEGSIITIEGVMPIDRTSIYSATISNLTGSDLNGDFNREVVMMKQIETTQAYLQLQYAPWSVVSQDVDDTTDRYIPLLAPLEAWRMNEDGTQIETILTPASGGIAPNEATYLLQTASSELPNAQVMGDLSSGLVVSTIGTGVQLTRSMAAVTGQLSVSNANGIGGNPTYGFDDNATFPGTSGLGLIRGTTAERPSIPVGTNFRYNTDINFIEYWNGSSWMQLSENGVATVEGTEFQVLVNGGFGTPEIGDIILTLPQDIATTSSPTFGGFAAINGISSFYDSIRLGSATTPASDPSVIIFSPTASLGTFSITSANNADNFNNVLTHASASAGRTWTLPDASGTIALTSGTVTTATNLAGGSANDIPYQTAAGTTSFITETANGVLVYSAGGVPSSSTILPSGLAATNMNLTTPTLGVASATSINFGGTTLSQVVDGAFSPLLNFGGATTGITYSSAFGRYSRIGNTVTFSLGMALTNKGSATGVATITGMPVPTRSGSITVFTIYAGAVTAVGPVNTTIGASSTTISIGTINFATGIAANVDNTNFANTSVIYVSGTYLVNA